MIEYIKCIKNNGILSLIDTDGSFFNNFYFFSNPKLSILTRVLRRINKIQPNLDTTYRIFSTRVECCHFSLPPPPLECHSVLESVKPRSLYLQNFFKCCFSRVSSIRENMVGFIWSITQYQYPGYFQLERCMQKDRNVFVVYLCHYQLEFQGININREHNVNNCSLFLLTDI